MPLIVRVVRCCRQGGDDGAGAGKGKWKGQRQGKWGGCADRSGADEAEAQADCEDDCPEARCCQGEERGRR